MDATDFSDKATRLFGHLSKFQRAGDGFKACCPAHEDRDPSLSISPGKDGQILVHDFGGCDTESVVAAAGCTMADLMPPWENPPRNGARPTSPSKQIVATYPYVDDDGAERYQKIRYEPKGFHIRRRGEDGGWVFKDALAGQTPLIYRQPKVKAVPPGATIVVAGGEKDVDNLRAQGYVATCNIDGEGNWRAEHAAHLPDGCRLVVMLDNDKVGEKFGRDVAASIAGKAASIKLVRFPELPEHGDVSDFIAGGGTKDELEARIAAAPEWAPEAEPWPELSPLSDQKLPPFPLSSLPPVLRDWARAESIATQTPADLAGFMSLATVSAAAGCNLEVEAREGFVEHVNLFISVVLEPGNRKSAVFSDAVRPLMAIESAEQETAAPIVARDQEERDQIEARRKKARKQCVDKGNQDACDEAIRLAQELAMREPLVMPRRIVSDATPEKIGIMLGDQKGRLASMSAEGGVFDLMAGLYSKSGSPNFDVYLKGHAGDPIVVDRVSRATIQVERPALVCAYTIQSAVVQGLVDKPAFRGRGLLARFLYAVPRSRIGYRDNQAPPMPKDVADAFAGVVSRMTAIAGPVTLTLADDARRVFESWESEIEVELRDGGALEVIRDWGAKLAGATLRLAGLLHAAEHGAQVPAISSETISAAIKIARYLIPHAAAAIALMGAEESQVNDDARYLLRWIQQGQGDFLARDARKHGEHRFAGDDERFNAAIDSLVDRGYIRLLPAEKRRGRPSPRFEVNPEYLQIESPEESCQNRQKPSAGDPEPSFDGFGRVPVGVENENHDSSPESFDGFGRVAEEIENAIPEDEWEAA